MTEHVVNLYMHEVAMHVDHNVDEFKPPFTEAALRGSGGNGEIPLSLTPVHISALSICLKSIDGIFETFLRFDVETIRCLPVAHFVRVAYAVVVLIKMYFTAATPNSELGKVINKDNMKVEQYLDGLVSIFKASAAQEKSRPSAKFLMVLIMLKTWFHRQREGKPPAPPAEKEPPTTVSPALSKESNQSIQQRPAPLARYSPANTSLQLLSEVATGNSGGPLGPSGVSNYSVPPNDWQQQQTFNYDPSINQGPQNLGPGYGNQNMGGNIDPALNMDLVYTMGDGFEQAMGMTLGAGDFGAYFNDVCNYFPNHISKSHGGERSWESGHMSLLLPLSKMRILS